MKRFQIQSLVASLIVFGFALSGFGGVWLETESTYKGDGLFRYRISRRQSAMIADTTVTSFSLNLTNVIPANLTAASVPPEGWTARDQGRYLWFTYGESLGWQPCPYEAIFEVRSSYTNFQRGTVILLMSLTMYEYMRSPTEPVGSTPVYSANIVGYWNCPAVVPCPPEHADGSANTMVTNISIPDIAITGLIRDGQAVHGVTFNSLGNGSDYDGLRTYLLEATRDWTNWMKVAYIHGVAGQSVWSNTVPLNHWGNFFRMQYVGRGHVNISVLPPLDNPAFKAESASVINAKTSAVSSSIRSGKIVTSNVRAQGSSIQVTANAVVGRKYKVSVFSAGSEVWSTQVTAKTQTIVVSVPIGSLPPSGVIKTEEI